MNAAYARAYLPGSKTAVYYTKDMFDYNRNNIEKTEHPLLLENRFDIEAKALVFPPHHFLFDVIDQKLQQYIEGGLVDQSLWYPNLAYDPRKYKVLKDSFAILTLSDLEAGFVVCIAPLLLSIFVFGCEWLLTLKDLMVVTKIFEKYYHGKTTVR